jgi:hypothetical protein
MKTGVIIIILLVSIFAALMIMNRRHDNRVVAFLVIASDGPEYDSMKAVWTERWRRRGRALPDAHLWFLYGDGVVSAPSGHDRAYPSVRESLVPGVLNKTVLAMRDCLAETNADVVIRTNLSSVYLWDRTAAFLERWRGDVAGLSPDGGGHIGGCNMIMSRRAVQWLVDHEHLLDREKLDDVAISHAFSKNGFRVDGSVPRCDVLEDGKRFVSGKRPYFHIRFKQWDRRKDVEEMKRYLRRG